MKKFLTFLRACLAASILFFTTAAIVVHSKDTSAKRESRGNTGPFAVPGESAVVEPSEADRPKSVAQLSAVFFQPLPPRAPDQKPDSPRSQAPQHTALPTLIAIGLITDTDGIERLYLKNPSTGTITRVRTSGLDESNARLERSSGGAWTVFLDGTQYSVQGALR